MNNTLFRWYEKFRRRRMECQMERVIDRLIDIHMRNSMQTILLYENFENIPDARRMVKESVMGIEFGIKILEWILPFCRPEFRDAALYRLRSVLANPWRG